MNSAVETGVCGRRICSRGRGGPPDFPRRQRPRRVAPCGGVVRHAPPAGKGCNTRIARAMQQAQARSGLLFLTRRIRLPRRNIRPRRPVRLPAGQRHPRGFRRPAEAHEPSDEIGARQPKHRQDGGWARGKLCVHAAIPSGRVLTDGSGGTASTRKIVSDVVGTAGDLPVRHPASGAVLLLAWRLAVFRGTTPNDFEVRARPGRRAFATGQSSPRSLPVCLWMKCRRVQARQTTDA
jgi:hypothetical protein